MLTLTQPPAGIWDRQTGEPNRWYARFECYRLTGPKRSLLGTVAAEREQQGTKKSSSVPQAWFDAAKQWHWKERAEAWDEHEREEARKAHASAVKEMNERHAQEARALQSKALQRLQTLNPEDMSAPEVLRFFIDAAKLERTALGEPQTVAEQRLTGNGGGPVNVTCTRILTDEELTRIVESGGDGTAQPPEGPSQS